MSLAGVGFGVLQYCSCHICLFFLECSVKMKEFSVF